MNRENKFRVWDLMESKWLEEYWVISPWGTVQVYNSYGTPIPPRKRVSEGEEYVVQQSTGILDKNKKLIFEGDILKFNWYAYDHCEPEEFIEEIFWDKESAGFLISRDCGWSLFEVRGVEVVGNIFENKNLL